jgi:hypothetical protein
MSYETLGIVSTQGKARIAQMLASGKSFQVTHFVIGDQGHLSTDPTIALTPDPSLVDYLYGNVLIKPVGAVTFPTPTCPQWECVVEPGDYSGPISSLYLLGTVVYSPTPGDPDIGLQFIFAVSTRPRSIKGPLDRFTFQVGIFL